MLEKDLFPPLKKYFNSLGYKVFPEIPKLLNDLSRIDFVAVKGSVQIAVEMKLKFNNSVIKQAINNQDYFGRNYIAFPVNNKIDFCDLKEITFAEFYKFNECRDHNIGILEVLPDDTIFETLKCKYVSPEYKYSLRGYVENDDDVAGINNQDSKYGCAELTNIQCYLLDHKEADWKELYRVLPNRYDSAKSMARAIKQWSGFDIKKFKKITKNLDCLPPRNHNGINIFDAD